MGKRALVVGVFLAVLLLVAVVVQRKLLANKVMPQSVQTAVADSLHITPPAEQAVETVVLKSTSGLVEVRDSAGKWQALDAGDQLRVDDVIRTAADAKAVVELGDNVVVDVAEATTLSIKQVSNSLSRVALADGRVVSRVKGKDDFRFRVEIRSSEAVAETASGEFGVLKRGSGPASVAAKSGSVELRGQHGNVQLKAGEMSTVAADGTLTPASKIPSSLFLKFGPTPKVSSKKSVKLSGSTSPGASVVVDGKRSTADGTGHFSRRVALKQGKNEILVVVEDPLGRKRSATPRITLRAGPEVKGEVQW